MKLFQTVIEQFADLGICSKQSIQSIKRISLTYVCQGFGCISIGVYLLRDANTLEDYSIANYMFGAEIFITLDFINLVLKMEKFFEFNESIQKMIDSSE